MSNSLVSQLTATAQQESSGGGIIGKVKLETGYKVFVAGLSNADSFFPCDFDNAKSKAAAKEKAQALGKPTASFQTIVYKDSVKGRDVTWQGDRYFTVSLWTREFKEIVLPALGTAGIDKLGEHWARVSFKPEFDETFANRKAKGKAKTNQAGEEVPDLIAFVAEKYANEKAAEAAAAGDNPASPTPKVASANGSVPAAWVGMESDWAKLRTQLAAEYADKPEKIVKAALAKRSEEIGVTADEIDAVVASFGRA